MRPVGPVDTVHLFPRLHDELMSLLRGLAAEAWERPTGVGSAVVVEVAGEAGGVWSVVRIEEGWALFDCGAEQAAARLALDADAAWRLLFNRLPPEDAARRVAIRGDERLGSAALRARAIMV